MSTIFEKIICGDIPSYKIFEDSKHLAFLDAFPVELGHVLVIPKKSTDYLFDLESDEYLELWHVTRKVAKAMDKALICNRIGIAVIGLEVPHAHIHLVPLNGDCANINFEKEKQKFTKQEMMDVAYKISQEI